MPPTPIRISDLAQCLPPMSGLPARRPAAPTPRRLRRRLGRPVPRTAAWKSFGCSYPNRARNSAFSVPAAHSPSATRPSRPAAPPQVPRAPRTTAVRPTPHRYRQSGHQDQNRQPPRPDQSPSCDNAATESLNSLYKRELADLRDQWKGIADVTRAVMEWVEWPNAQRLQTYCNNVSLFKYEEAFYRRHQTAA